MPYSAVIKDETYNIIVMCNEGNTIYFRVNGKLANETGICEPYNVEPINVDLTVDSAPENYLPVCGNNIIEPGEQCEENNFAGLTCQDFGYDNGDLKCVDCQRDLSNCYNSNTGGSSGGGSPGGRGSDGVGGDGSPGSTPATTPTGMGTQTSSKGSKTINLTSYKNQTTNFLKGVITGSTILDFTTSPTGVVLIIGSLVLIGGIVALNIRKNLLKK